MIDFLLIEVAPVENNLYYDNFFRIEVDFLHSHAHQAKISKEHAMSSYTQKVSSKAEHLEYKAITKPWMPTRRARKNSPTNSVVAH